MEKFKNILYLMLVVTPSFFIDGLKLIICDNKKIVDKFGYITRPFEPALNINIPTQKEFVEMMNRLTKEKKSK